MYIVKVHRVFPSIYNIIASSRFMHFHRDNVGDSRTIVTPFMQDGTYPSRNFATLGPSKLQPPFTGTYVYALHIFFILQHWAGVKLYTTY